MEKIYYKICLLGDSGVGKTSIMHRYLHDTFETETVSTIGAAFHGQDLVYENQPIRLQIWDTAGQERYRTLAPLYYRHASLVLVIIDATRPKTVPESRYWLDQLMQD